MVTIVVVNWNTGPFLRRCLASIAAHPPRAELEVVVVDNASRDGSAELVRAEFPWVRLLAQSDNLGYAEGNNAGFAVASGEYVLALNPDTEFVDDSLDRAIALLAADPKAGALGARQIGPDGLVQRSVRGFPDLAGLFGDATGLGARFPGGRLDGYRRTAFDYGRSQLAPQPMGTFLLFKVAALASVGDPRAPFDPEFPIFFNEVDLLYRLASAGWSCRYEPEVRILHHGGESTKQVRRSMIWESHKSLVRFLRKHRRGPLPRLGIALLAGLIYAGAFVRAKGYDRGFGSRRHRL